jgi:nucleoside-diphosphate-sugar epimerase
MKILVTGGKGYIGGLLVKRLAEAGHEVSTFDLVDGQSLLDREQVHASIKGMDVVFHLAAVADLTWSARSHENMLATVDVNVLGTTNVAFACAAEGVLLQFASTCCVYGNQDVHPSTELTLPNPAEVYAYSKLAGESVVKGFGVSMGLKFNIMRYATVYGPGMREALGVSVFMHQALGLDKAYRSDCDMAAASGQPEPVDVEWLSAWISSAPADTLGAMLAALAIDHSI